MLGCFAKEFLILLLKNVISCYVCPISYFFKKKIKKRACKQALFFNVTNFQVANSLLGIDDWEVFSSSAAADMVPAKRVKNLYLKVYVELSTATYKPEEVTYSFTEDYTNNSSPRSLFIKNHGTAASVGNGDVITAL